MTDEHPGLVAEGANAKEAARNLERLLDNLRDRGAISPFELVRKPVWYWQGFSGDRVSLLGRSGMPPLNGTAAPVVGDHKFLTA